MKRNRDEFAALPVAVRDALGVLREVREADPSTWEARRETYLAEVRAYVQRENRAYDPGVVQNTVTSGVLPRRRGWKSAVEILSRINLKEAKPMAIALNVMIVLALVFGGSAGAVTAARGSLPGSPLYGLKVQVERWEIERVSTHEDLAERALTQAQERVEEATRLAGEQKSIPIDVAVRFQQQLSLALQASGSIEEAHRLQFQSRLSEALQYQIRTMTQLMAGVKDDNGDDDAIRAMIQAIEQAETQLALRQGRGDSSGAGQAAENRPEDGRCDGAEECAGEGNGPNEDASGYGPGDGTGDGEPDEDGDGYGPGVPPEETPGYGPGDGTGDGGPDEDGDGYGPGVPPEETPGYGPGDETGDGEPDEDGDGYGPGTPPENTPGDGAGDGSTGNDSGAPDESAPGDGSGGGNSGGSGDDGGAGNGNH